MTRDEAIKAEAAIKEAGELGAPRIFSFDRINDDPNNLALRLIVHAREGDSVAGIMAKTSMRNLLTQALGREPKEDEIIIKNQALPTQTAGLRM